MKSTEAKVWKLAKISGDFALTGRESLVKGTDKSKTRLSLAKSELGTKRIDPETGQKFYDLNKDPIVSPYTGKTYPRSFFESGPERVRDKEDEDDDNEGADETPETVSLEDADEEAAGGDDVPDLDDDDDVDLGDDDDDTFLEEEEEDDDNVSDIIGVGDDEDDT